MSFLTRTALRSQRVSLRPSITSIRPLQVSAARTALSESDHSIDEDVRKKAIDEHKDDQMEKQKQGKGHWKRELGSNSESAIKADREEIANAGRDIDQLQKETASALEEDHEHGKK
ncbi:hypothetical protein ACLMJK_003495 [Lecanora helva]